MPWLRSAAKRARQNSSAHRRRRRACALLDAVGHPVLSLVRVQVGPIHLGDTKPGKMRPLTRAEVGKLYSAAGL